MKLTLTTTAALLLTTAASAGGIDRTLNNYSVLFEDSNYVELAFGFARPDVSGEYPAAAPFGGGSTGNMSEDFETAAFSMKYELNPTLDMGLFVNQPFGADALYTDGLYTGLQAEWDSNQIALVLKYQATPNISVYGGVRSIESQANILIPNALIALPIAESLGTDARAQGAQAQAVGAQALALADQAQQAATQAGVLGQRAAIAAANLDPRAATIAARAQALGAQAQDLAGQAQALGTQAQAQGDAATALGAQAQAIADIARTASPTDGPYTYRANTESDRRTSLIMGAAYERPEIALRVALTYEQGYTHEFDTVETIPALGAFPVTSVTEIEMPDVLTLDFQSGVAPGTLVFGSIRHATWSDWTVSPAGYLALTGGPVTSIDDDVTTYRIGVGRAFTDQISGFARFTYEDGSGDVLSRLAPTDGSRAFGVGGSYTTGAIKVTGGVEFIDFGDGTDGAGTVFADNDAVALGVSVGYSF